MENVNPPHHDKSFVAHCDTISSIIFNPNQYLLIFYFRKQLITGSLDNNLLLWNLVNKYEKPIKLQGHTKGVNDVSISPNGLLIASASSDETIRIWDNTPNNTDKFQVLKHNKAPMRSVDFSCDNKMVVTACDDQTVKLISLHDKKMKANLLSHTNWLKCVRFSSDSKLIVSCGDDRTVKMWDTDSARLVYTIQNQHHGVVNSVRFHPDDSCIATGCFDKKIRVNYN